VVHMPTDAVRTALQKAATSGVSLVVSSLTDPVGTVKRTADDVRELPRQVVRLPLRLALQALELTERLRTLRSRGDGDGDGYADLREARPTTTPAPTIYAAPPRPAVPTEQDESGVEAVGEEPLFEQVEALLVDAAAESPFADSDAIVLHAGPAADAPPAPTTGAPVTPIHAGRDGHREIELPPVAEAAVESAPAGATLRSAELPLANYDGLSMPQIRGRLSKLDVVALTQLRDYERAHADRAPVVTMLENRLAKVAEALDPLAGERRIDPRG